MQYCQYYQAQVKREFCWFLVGILKSYEHMAFDRTIDKERSIFEFYVPPKMQRYFEELMDYFLKEGIITSLEQKENRLLQPDAQV